MDGGSHRQEQYGASSHPAGPSIGRHVMQQMPAGPMDRFQQAQTQPTRQSRLTAPDNPDQAPGHTFAALEYAGSPSYNTSPFPSGGPLQAESLPYQQGYASDPSRQHTSQTTQQQQHPPGLAQRIQQQQQEQYGTNMVYDVTPQGQQRPSYGVESNVQPRQSTAIEVLATQFGVPQYFPPDAQGGANVSGQYLTGQVAQTPYSQPTSTMRASVPTTFPDVMPDFNSAATSESIEAQDLPRETPKIDDGYNRYQQTLRQTFEYTRAGQVVEASQLLLEISEWLLNNVSELGLTRDDQELHDDRIKLWEEFNTCWLTLCQRQKDMTLETMHQSGSRPNNILTEDALDKMAKELVRICDKLEHYGLVDYQMGVWEEEILNVLCQCLDLLDRQKHSSCSATTRRNRARHSDPSSAS